MPFHDVLSDFSLRNARICSSCPPDAILPLADIPSHTYRRRKSERMTATTKESRMARSRHFAPAVASSASAVADCAGQRELFANAFRVCPQSVRSQAWAPAEPQQRAHPLLIQSLCSTQPLTSACPSTARSAYTGLLTRPGRAESRSCSRDCEATK